MVTSMENPFTYIFLIKKIALKVCVRCPGAGVLSGGRAWGVAVLGPLMLPYAHYYYYLMLVVVHLFITLTMVRDYYLLSDVIAGRSKVTYGMCLDPPPFSQKYHYATKRCTVTFCNIIVFLSITHTIWQILLRVKQFQALANVWTPLRIIRV